MPSLVFLPPHNTAKTMALCEDTLKQVRQIIDKARKAGNSNNEQSKRKKKQGGGGGGRGTAATDASSMTNGHHHNHHHIPTAYPTIIDSPSAPVSGSNVCRVRFSPAAASNGHPAVQGMPPDSATSSSSRATRQSASDRKGSSSSLMMNGDADQPTGYASGDDENAALRPSKRKQAQDVQRLLRQARSVGSEKGDIWALLPAPWWTAWQEYVGWDKMEIVDQDDDQQHQHTEEGDEQEGVTRTRPHRSKSVEMEELSPGDYPAPHAIDNTTLLARPSKIRIKDGLQEGKDWVAVPLEVWNALRSWYGGEPSIFRPVAKVGADGQVELDLEPQKGFDQDVEMEEVSLICGPMLMLPDERPCLTKLAPVAHLYHTI